MELILAILLAVFLAAGIWYGFSDLWEEDDVTPSNDTDRETPNPAKPEVKKTKRDVQKLKNVLIQSFSDSGWVILYTLVGYFSILLLIICLFTEQWNAAFAAACMAGSCFFAAHLLRVQERTAHHSEQQTKLLEKILEERQK